MISIRSILLILVLIGIFYASRKIRQRMKRLQQARNEKPPIQEKHAVVLRCDHCGLHIPEQEAIHYNNKIFCCEQHKKHYH